MDHKYCIEYDGINGAEFANTDRLIINGIPYTEREKGEWIRDGVGLFKCSVCGRRICTSISEDNPHINFPFCHCGADMKPKSHKTKKARISK